MTVTEKKSRGITKPKLIFTLFDDGDGGGIKVMTDGVQWLLEDGNSRWYYQTLESVFKKVINEEFSRISEGTLDHITQVRDLMKRAWSECRGLAEAIKNEAESVKMSAKP